MRKIDMSLLDINKHNLLCFNGSKRFDCTDSKFKESYVIVRDNTTNELFKVVMPVICYKSYYNQYTEYDMGKIDTLNKINLDFPDRQELSKSINDFQETQLRPIIYNFYDRKLFSSSTSAIKFCDAVLKLSGINKSIVLSREYTKNIRELLDPNKIVYFQEFVDYNNDVLKLVSKEQCAESISITCRRYKKYLDALYKMYDATSPFAGSYKITKDRFSETKSENFDIIRISFQMVSNRSKVYDYIKKHPEFREEIIRPIFNHHAKKYANFMRLYDVVLIHTNELVFSFCFKEEVEKLLSGESK